MSEIDLKDVVVRYFYHPNTGAGIGCVVAVNTPQGIKIGWSQCNPKDTFNRKAARAIAIQRAVNPPVKPLVPASVKFKLFRPSENPFIPPSSSTVTITNPLEPLIEAVESIAKRAFGPRENPPIHDTADCNETCDHREILRDADGGILGFVVNGVFEPIGVSEETIAETDRLADEISDKVF